MANIKMTFLCSNWEACSEGEDCGHTIPHLPNDNCMSCIMDNNKIDNKRVGGECSEYGFADIDLDTIHIIDDEDVEKKKGKYVFVSPPDNLRKIR